MLAGVNTPGHIVLNLLVVGRGSGQPWKPILLGALLPDLPMLVLYAVERGVLGTPERLIWQQSYFSESWQLFIDVFNSLPLIGLLFVIAHLRRWPFVKVVAISMALHAGTDLLVHHDDAHRHFLPFSQWRFASPVSYWDPAHHGRMFAVSELGAVVFGCLWLSARGEGAVRRLGVALLVATLGFVLFAVTTWGPLG